MTEISPPLSIAKVYEKFSIPPGLQKHMYTTAALGMIICDHWSGPTLQKENIIMALLLHDLGNLIKFDLSDTAQILDESLFTPYWRSLQSQQKKTYGNDAHTATLNMARECIQNQEVIALIDGMDTAYLEKIAQGSLEQQICEYADLRVTPKGITSLAERLADIQKRYSASSPQWANSAHFAQSLQFAQIIENTLQKNTDIDITQIPSEKIEAYLVKLPQYTFEISA